jgi:DNA-binding GntR family transcriptional regulator
MPGDQLPAVEILKLHYQVSAGTTNRAIAVLKATGIVSASNGQRAQVRNHGSENTHEPHCPIEPCHYRESISNAELTWLFRI